MNPKGTFRKIEDLLARNKMSGLVKTLGFLFVCLFFGQFSQAVTCPSHINVANAVGQCGASVGYTLPFGHACGDSAVVRIQGLGNGSFFPVGTTTETYRLYGMGGCPPVTCSFRVSVSDIGNPSINCPSNITVPNDPGDCGALIHYTVTGTDNCPGIFVHLMEGLPDNTVFPIGQTPVSWINADASGRNVTCSFIVRVNDTEAPVLVCPANMTVQNTPGQLGAIVNYTAPLGVDNCPGATTSLASGLGTGAFFPIGVNREVYNSTDAYGNSSSCSFTIEVLPGARPMRKPSYRMGGDAGIHTLNGTAYFPQAHQSGLSYEEAGANHSLNTESPEMEIRMNASDASAHLNVAFPSSQNVEISLYDIRGNKVQDIFSGSVSAGQSIDLQLNLPAGREMYLAKLSTQSGHSQYKKIIN